MENITIEEAQKKIGELNKFIEEQERNAANNKHGITKEMVKPGAVFCVDGSNEPITLICDTDAQNWWYGGVRYNAFHMYYGQAQTADEVLKDLQNHGYKFLSSAKTTYIA